MRGLEMVLETYIKSKVFVESNQCLTFFAPVLMEDGQRVAICSGFHQDLLFFDLESGRLDQPIHLPDFPEVAMLQKDHPDKPFSKAIFVSGLEIIGPDRLLVGIAPATILEVDAAGNRLIDVYCYSHDVGDAVHGLAHVPVSLALAAADGGQRSRP